jgi:hypothetical protein
LAGIRIVTATRLPAAWLATAWLAAVSPGVVSAQQQMLPPAGGGIGSPSTMGTARIMPQAQSLAPSYAPPSSPSMPIPPMMTAPAAPIPGFGAGSQQVSLSLVARFGRDFPAPITNGLVWRIFPARPDSSGAFRAVKEEKAANPTLSLPSGDYVVHVSLGLVSDARAVHLRDAVVREAFELPAGGIKLEGRVGDVKIPPAAITFDIFKGSQFEQSANVPIAQGVVTGDVVVVPEGSYHIVSNYGDSNAVVRSDIRVQIGKLTEVTVSHRAALISLKLVGERGGDAIANTNWSIITPGGDVIKESSGIFPRIVLAEGDYRAIARNEGRTYERDFKVVTGVDGEVEVMAR